CGNDANCIGSLDSPDPSVSQSGVILVRGFALAQPDVAKIELFVDDQFVHRVNTGIPMIDVVNAFPNWLGIQNAAPGFQTGFMAHIDTTSVQDGVHQLTIIATDRLGLSRQIGRRTVQIFNSQTELAPFGYLDEPKPNATLFGTRCNVLPVVSPPINPQSHITP